MGAISIAFDITIVGALALPWVLLVVHLFFPSGENHVPSVLRWLRRLNQPAAVAVLLFAIAYFVGSAVSRTAQDFFNDDDLHLSGADLRSPYRQHWLVRVGVTENRILASVYCKNEEFLLAEDGKPLAAEIHDFKTHDCMCRQTLSWLVRLQEGEEEEDEALNDNAANIFGFQENTLLLKGEDPTARLRQLHDQVMVLRGAAFNGLLAFSLSVFALGAKIRREKSSFAARLAATMVPWIYVAVAVIAGFHHFGERAPAEPPYMEFTLGALGVAGMVLWKRVQPPRGDEAQQAEARTPAEEPKKPRKEAQNDAPNQDRGAWRKWAALAGLSGLLTAVAVLGWWSTEVLYTKQVIYSYDSQLATTKTKP